LGRASGAGGGEGGGGVVTHCSRYEGGGSEVLGSLGAAVEGQGGGVQSTGGVRGTSAGGQEVVVVVEEERAAAYHRAEDHLFFQDRGRGGGHLLGEDRLLGGRSPEFWRMFAPSVREPRWDDESLSLAVREDDFCRLSLTPNDSIVSAAHSLSPQSSLDRRMGGGGGEGGREK
jgi:hypothetical protein